jgi:hypothetical protein
MLKPPNKITIAAGIGLAFCTIFALTAHAQGNIQVYNVVGSFDANSIVTINGTGFGLKSPARPVLWDDFEGGAIGAHIVTPVIGAYSRISSRLVYTNTGVHSGSRSAYEPITDDYWSNGLCSSWIPNEAKKSYVSMVVKMNSASGSLDVPDNKILRLNTADPDATHGYPGASLGEAGEGAFIYFMSNIGAVNQRYSDYPISAAEFGDPNNKFFSLGLWTIMSERDVANGYIGREFNGTIREQFNVETLDGTFTHGGTRNAYYSGLVQRNGSGELGVWLDEVYADTTLSRVFVRDLSHAGESGVGGGQVAMQIPQSWSNSSIEIRVNPGRYPTGTELSLVVYNAAGQASPAFTVTVGETSGGGDQGPPGAPSNVVFDPEGD